MLSAVGKCCAAAVHTNSSVIIFKLHDERFRIGAAEDVAPLDGQVKQVL